MKGQLITYQLFQTSFVAWSSSKSLLRFWILHASHFTGTSGVFILLCFCRNMSLAPTAMGAIWRTAKCRLVALMVPLCAIGTVVMGSGRRPLSLSLFFCADSWHLVAGGMRCLPRLLYRGRRFMTSGSFWEFLGWPCAKQCAKQCASCASPDPRFTGSWLWRAGTWKGCLRLPGPRCRSAPIPFQATAPPSHVLGHAALGNWPDVSAPLRFVEKVTAISNIFKHFQTFQTKKNLMLRVV
jgi:hypothetical protein